MKGMKVYFNNGTIKDFTGFWKDVLMDIASYCEVYNLETVHFDWIY